MAFEAIPNPNRKDEYMAKIELSDYNISELKGLQLDIEKEIRSRQNQEHSKAREQILSIAKETLINSAAPVPAGAAT